MASIIKGLCKTFIAVPILLGSVYSQSLAEQAPTEQADLSPVEFITEPSELSQNTPGKVNPSPPTTTTVPTISVPTISTSRPSFTDAVTTVPQGSLQAESGATFTDNRGGTYTWTVPETLLRLGLLNNTEFRFTTPTYIYTGSAHHGQLTSNFGDISVGMSQHLIAPGKVDVALIPILNIPTGANNVSSNSVDPQFRLVLGKYWTKKWFMSSHLDTRWNTGKDAAAHVVMNPTFINYYSLTEKLTGFLEYSGFYPTTGKTTQYLQSGMLFVPTPRQQFDARIAVGLNHNSPNILVGFGYSFRMDGLFGASRDFSSFKRPISTH